MKQVTAGDLAQEVYNQVCESEASLHRTCYTLHMTGPPSALADHVAVPVDPFQELKAVEPIRLYLETHFAAIAAAAAAAANNAAAAAVAAASVPNGKPNADEKPQLSQTPTSADDSSAEKPAQEPTAKVAEETGASGASESAPKEKPEGADGSHEKDGSEEAHAGEGKAAGKRGGRRGQAQGGAAGKHWRAHARWLKSSGLLDGAANEPAPPPVAATPPLPQAPPLVFTLVEGTLLHHKLLARNCLLSHSRAQLSQSPPASRFSSSEQTLTSSAFANVYSPISHLFSARMQPLVFPLLCTCCLQIRSLTPSRKRAARGEARRGEASAGL